MRLKNRLTYVFVRMIVRPHYSLGKADQQPFERLPDICHQGWPLLHLLYVRLEYERYALPLIGS